MTLGIFTDDYYPFIGGMGRYVYELSRRLPREHVLIFSPSDNTAANHVRVTPPFHHKLKNLSFSLWLHRHLPQLIRAYRLSAVNIQCGPGGLFLLRSTGIPAIATVHHTWWQQSRYILTQFWKRLFVPFERRTYMLADKVLCDAADTQRILVEAYKIPRQKIAVIPIGVDGETFYADDRTEKIQNSLLFIGRLDKRKGIDFLIGAMPGVVARIPDATLYVGGTGRNRSRLMRFAKKRCIDKHVVFLDFIPEHQLNAWYNRVQCVIVPSIFEGFGLTVIEAMSAGTAVIATAVDSLRDLISDGVDGCLVGYGDVPMLENRIVSLLGNESLRMSFVRNGLEKVNRKYRWDQVIDAFREQVFCYER